ncbi:MAG: crossover junction endodeoxyribonuclease RuvC [Calothrix sp. FI2-JRJ7]|jgi:crossover junction endodeoxyribonuclease RuvC|nr:crossover junction endodeoxyribonuclease RuvC [Calothrix sp. FI2-JRJ7]
MKILAIDTGYSNLGYTIYDINQKQLILVETFTTSKDKNFEQKLVSIFGFFRNLIVEHKPNILVYENPIMSNATGAKIQNAIGLLLYLAAFNKMKVVSYSATEIKKVVTGSGKADKQQIMDNVASRFYISYNFTSDHASDSAAVCLTYLIKNNLLVS